MQLKRRRDISRCTMTGKRKNITSVVNLSLVLFVFIALMPFSSNAQWMKINLDGGKPDASAALELSDTSRGMLTTRLTTSQMNAIASPAEGLLIYNTDTNGFMYYDSSQWVVVGTGTTASGISAPNEAGVMVLWDQKTQNTDGGTATSGSWATRDLNQTSGDTSIATLSSNQFTPSAGIFLVDWSAPAREVHAHQSRLYNVTQGTVVAMGTSEFSEDNDDVTNRSTGSVVIETNGSDAYRIEHRVEITKNTVGFGEGANFGDEIFTTVKLIKADKVFGGGATNVQVLADSDADTYVSVETSAGTDNDEIKFNTAGSERMMINSSGNVGIGTTSPLQLLHVSSGTSGDAQLLVEADTDNDNENDNPAIFLSQDGGSNYGWLGLNGAAGALITDAKANSMVIGTQQSNDLHFFTGGKIRMTILGSNGNTAYGTALPGADFHVKEEDGGDATMTVETDDTDDDVDFRLWTPNQRWSIVNDQPDRRLYFNNYTASKTIFSLDDGGDVGIGIRDADELLHLNSVNEAIIRIDADSNANNNDQRAGIQFYKDGGASSGWLGLNGDVGQTVPSAGEDAMIMGTFSDKNLHLFTDSVVRLTILNGFGNAGIGTASPGYDWHVKEENGSNATLGIETADASGDANVLFLTQNTNFEILNDGATDKLYFNNYTSSQTIMTLEDGGDIGIGTTAPNEKLDVEGAIEVDGDYKYETTQTRYKSISHAAFTMSTQADSVQVYRQVVDILGENQAWAARTMGGDASVTTHLIASVELPDSAVVTQVQAGVIDANATYNCNIQLIRQPIGGTFGTGGLASVSSSGSGGTQTITDNTIASSQIDNSLYTYYLIWETQQATTSLGLMGVRITYTVTKAQ